MRTRLPLVLGSLLLLAIPAARAQWRPNATGAAWDSRPDRLSVDGLAVASVNGSGLVLASLDGGVTATLSSRTSNPPTVDQLAVGAGVFYANTGSYRADTPGTGLYRSADGGATWTNVSAGLAAAFGNPIFSIFGVGVDGAAVYASVVNRLGIPSTKALYRSLDGGA